jgi:hypothetical protein
MHSFAVEERRKHQSPTTRSRHMGGSMKLSGAGLHAAYLFERRQAAGAVPNAFLKAREKAASEL